MLINGVDLSVLGIQLYDRILESNSVDTSQEWLEGDIQPTFIRQQDKFKNIQLKFLVLKDNEAEAFLVMSKLTSMLKKASIIFDDIDLIFDVTMRGPATQSRLKNGNFILTFNLRSDYAKGATEVYTTDSVATDYFKLKVLYYKEGNILLVSDEVMIKASQFNENTTFASLGINIDKYKPDYFQGGAVTNFNNKELTFVNLKDIGTLIINYAPILYQKEVVFYRQAEEDGEYTWIEDGTLVFTKSQIDEATSLGDLIDFTSIKPNGYRVLTDFNSGLFIPFTFEGVISLNRLTIRYELIKNEQSKQITVNYSKEDDEGNFTFVNASSFIVKESDIVPGAKITNLISVDLYKPQKYYNSGNIVNFNIDNELSFENLPASLNVQYELTENRIYVEYYYGSYPTWSRITSHIYNIKYKTVYENSENILNDIGIDLDRYLTAEYNNGKLYNVSESIASFDDLINIGVLQVFYSAKDFDLAVEYYQDDALIGTRTFTINAPMFLSNPALAQIIDINAFRSEGYIFNEDESYGGVVDLGTLLANAPIKIFYKEVETVKTKSIVIRYKQELASAYSVINTSIITIEESQVGGGVTLPDLFDLNAHRPEYYDAGIIDGVSSSAVFTFDELQGAYNVLYMASQYSTPVRYYSDEVADENWIGSDSLRYTVLSFGVDTTLVDLGLNINGFKPSYCGDGEVLYTGPVNFASLRALESINVLYMSTAEPDDPDAIDYPHRILFLQHNDMGDYERLYPTWTMNHAYINTGVTCEDVSKLSVLVDTYRVFETEPLYNVNVQDAYLFGAVSPSSSYYIKYRNNTKFRAENEITNVNEFRVNAGYGTPDLVIEESASEGFSSNTGISASTRDGYSYGTLTFTHLVQSNTARMDVPLYLFGCDYNGYYRGGIAGVGIRSCKIYYDGTLIRDFIPVAFYDLIGDKLAPSNCLYDKVTQTFFEDARELNSFNIIDDPNAVDDNPAHKIGKCFVNYYKDDVLFNTSTYYFRKSDFLDDKNWVEDTGLFMDDFQPQYCGSGTITNLAELGEVTFENVNNFSFRVDYKTTSYNIVVRYYKDEATAENLIAEDEISLSEKDFYQVPTFGQIVPIQKYKPTNYKATYEYNDTKVTLRRILNNSPYTIVYTEVENPKVYNTTIKYYRKRFGITPLNPLNDYDLVGTETLSLDETQFVDGVFVEKFINFNKYKPVSGVENVEFYKDGIPYEWYLQDEMLTTPDDLKEEYKVVYQPLSFPLEIRYYTDEVDEDNLIATSTWSIQIDDWPDGEQFQIVDELPNVYINQFKPIICWGGQLADPSAWYTFKSLVELGHIDIIYETKDEPHDPDDTDWPSKILWFDTQETDSGGKASKLGWAGVDIYELASMQQHHPFTNLTTPYLDLGYTPKEIGRLRSEIKAYCYNAGINTPIVSTYSIEGNDFAGFFGYYDAQDLLLTRQYIGKETDTEYTTYLKQQDGNFRYVGHTLHAGFDVAGELGEIQTVDGHTYYSHPGYFSGSGIYNNGDVESVRELTGEFRRGIAYIQDEDLNDVNIYKQYSISNDDGYKVYPNMDYMGIVRESIESPAMPVNLPTKEEDLNKTPFGLGGMLLTAGTTVSNFGENQRIVAGNPLTMTIDAYHNYVESYDYTNSMHPQYQNLNNEDIDVWEQRAKPKGSLTLGITRNPNSGKINWKPFRALGVLSGKGARHMIGLSNMLANNPYTTGFTKEIVIETYILIPKAESGHEQTGVGDTGHQGWDVQKQSKTIAVNYAGMGIDTFPIPARLAVWYLKIWDQDRLVRDLVPVEKGEKIYDYVVPANGMFDRVSEIFFGNANEGGTYESLSNDNQRDWRNIETITTTVTPEQVNPLHVCDDWTQWGKIIINYYDENNNFLGNQYVTIPLYSREANETLYDILRINDFKPDDFHHDGEFDVDIDFHNFENALYNPETHLLADTIRYGQWYTFGDRITATYLKEMFEQGAANIYYKLLTFTKTVEYYRNNTRVGSKDIFYTVQDIKDAQTLEDLGLDVDLYASEDYKPGRIVFDESILANDDIKAFIDAPSPVVIYDEYTAEEKPELFYVNWYRGGAYDNNLITTNPDNVNYLDCELDAKVLNPNGAIKYLNHYHTALYEDEKQDYFIAYQVDVDVNYLGVHKGPGRIYNILAEIVDKGRYTIIEEKRGWGRLREYPKGWIMLSKTHPVIGPGRNPAYDENQRALVTIPYAENITITKMTIDRLWCYCPEYASWLKTQDISFDQAGRLYNAIASKVLHLDTISDWTQISSWDDLGIDLNEYKMKYHEDAYTTYNGNLTHNLLSAEHHMDIINPETIYAYNVYYYKDAYITNETASGRATANEKIVIYNDVNKTEQKGAYNEGDSFIFYGSNALNPDILETEDGYIDIERNYTVTRQSSLNLDYPLVQNTTDHVVYAYDKGKTKMGSIQPNQVVRLIQKVVPEVLQYEDYNKGVYHFGDLSGLRSNNPSYNGEISDSYGNIGAANTTLPEGLEIIHNGSIISTGEYFGTGLTIKDAQVYNDNNEVVNTIPIGTELTLLDFENNRYQVEDGWIKKNSIKIIDFGPFKVSTQRSFRNPEIGRTSFSCSISDWNPDWPTFIGTNWQYETITTPGEGTSIGEINFYVKPDVTSGVYRTFAENVLFTLNNPKFTDDNNNYWYEITYDNITGYIQAQDLNVTTEVKVEPDHTKPINPTLYKDTPITLTWDFFDIDRNLYKPSEDYEDGMFLWNPRSYNNEDVYFTFEELITTGTQIVLYLPKYGKYKATFPYTSYINAQLSANFCTAPKEMNEGLYDMEIIANYNDSVFFPQLSDAYKNYRADLTDSMTIPSSEDNYYIVNISNKRDSTVVFAYGNDLNNYHSDYYGAIPDTSEYTNAATLVKITKNVNPLSSGLYWFAENDETVKNGSFPPDWTDGAGQKHHRENDKYVLVDVPETSSISYREDATVTEYLSGPVGRATDSKRTIYSLKKWKNFFLQNYIIPFPKGYIFNDRKIKENCLVDILTGEIFFPSKFPITRYLPNNGYYRLEKYVITPPIITKVGDRINYNGSGVSVDDSMIFDKTDINKFLTVVKNNTRSFRSPSNAATIMNTFNSNIVIPAFAKTEDGDHGVEGLWYSDNKAWFEAYRVSLVPAETYPEILKQENMDLAIKGDEHNSATEVTRFIVPSGNDSSGNITTERVVHVYASYGNRYWTGTEWIEKDMTETNMSAYANTKTYVVSKSLLNVYSHPIVNDAYRLVTIQNGDRLTVNKYLTRDEAWKYAEGLGWIDSTDALSEVI